MPCSDRSSSPTIDDHGERRNMYGSHGKGTSDGGIGSTNGHEAREVRREEEGNIVNNHCKFGRRQGAEKSLPPSTRVQRRNTVVMKNKPPRHLPPMKEEV